MMASLRLRGRTEAVSAVIRVRFPSFDRHFNTNRLKWQTLQFYKNIPRKDENIHHKLNMVNWKETRRPYFGARSKNPRE